MSILEHVLHLIIPYTDRSVKMKDVCKQWRYRILEIETDIVLDLSSGSMHDTMMDLVCRDDVMSMKHLYNMYRSYMLVSWYLIIPHVYSVEMCTILKEILTDKDMISLLMNRLALLSNNEDIDCTIYTVHSVFLTCPMSRISTMDTNSVTEACTYMYDEIVDVYDNTYGEYLQGVSYEDPYMVV